VSSSTVYSTSGVLLEFLEKVFGPSQLSNGGLNASFVCPICLENNHNILNKKKLVIRTDNGLTHCWVCSFKGRTFFKLLKEYHPDHLREFFERFGKTLKLFRYSNDDNLDEEAQASSLSFEEKLHKIIELEELYLQNCKPKQNITLPDGFLFLPNIFKEKYNWIYLDYFKYLKKRDITEDDIWYYKLGVAIDNKEGYSKRIIIPSLDDEGEINFYTSRAIYDFIKPKYFSINTERKDIVFNELNIDWNKELIITEGPFDLFKCPKNATCLVGSELNDHYKLFKKIIENKTPIVMALDTDAQVKSYKIIKNMLEYEIQVRMVTIPKDKNDLGSLTKSLVRHLINESKEVTWENLFYWKLTNKIND
jgi:hypothetical protein